MVDIVTFKERWATLEKAVATTFSGSKDRQRVVDCLRAEGVVGIDLERLGALQKIRNVLTHNPQLDGRDMVAFDEAVIRFLEDATSRILHPLTAMDIYIPLKDVYECSLGSNLCDVVDTMIDMKYSHVPVLDNTGRVIGVFSESTGLELERLGIGHTDARLVIDDFRAYLPVDRHRVDAFHFVARTETVAHLRQICAAAVKKRERIGMFFVTRSGDQNEPLEGILTVWDIAGIAA